MKESSKKGDAAQPNRREFLKTTSKVTAAGALAAQEWLPWQGRLQGKVREKN